MSVAAILTRARELGITLEATPEGAIRARPKTPPDLGAEIRAHKAELLTLLVRPEGGDPPATNAAVDGRLQCTVDEVTSIFPGARLMGVREIAEKSEAADEAPIARPAAKKQQIDIQVREELGRWWPQLRVMGWSEERIWSAEFWPHMPEHPRGLAGVLQPGDRILFADADVVHIVTRNGSTLKFRKQGRPNDRQALFRAIEPAAGHGCVDVV